MADFDQNLNNNEEQEKNSSILEKNHEMTDSQDIIDREDEKGQASNQASNKEGILTNPVANPIWLSVSEAAKICGVSAKTIRRAITAGDIRYKIYKNRYLIGLRSLIIYLHSNKKLQNKLNFNGIGQYITGWRK